MDSYSNDDQKYKKILHYPYMLWIVDAGRASVYLEQKFARMH